ncbi:MAG TPA: hypothetical protein VGK37_10990 [Casimicrobiaceae bacterium]|jgi:hypothetical protein
MRRISFYAASVVVIASAIPAEAMVCNIVLDRNDQVIYRDVSPPLDLSDGGARARAAMRQRGEYLMVIDTDRCLRVAPATATSGTASVEEIVGEMRPYLGRSGGGARGVVRTAAPAAATSSRSSSARGY